MNLQLAEKTAFVSGSTAGIGLAIAAGLAREGVRVILNGRTRARVDEAIGRIKAVAPDAHVRGLPADLGTAAGCAAVVEHLPEVDILVNNLGIFEPKPFEEISDNDWSRFFQVNVLSGVRLSRAYLPGMRRKNWGRILFISSESGLHIPVEMVHYGVTKTAQLAVARGLAESCAGTGITVNSVLPGPTASEGVTAFVDQLARQAGQSKRDFEQVFFQQARPSSLLKRFLAPDEVASLVVYLCSPLASGVTGAALRVDGGVVRSIA